MGAGRVCGLGRFLPGAVVCGLMLCFGASWSAVLEVPGDYATIQDAVDAASDGDGIRIEPGTYSGGAWIDGKGVSLYSAVSGEKVVMGSILVQNAGIVRVRDFSLSAWIACVEAYNTERIELVDCIMSGLYASELIGPTACGMRGDTIQEIHIEGCTLEGAVGSAGFQIFPGYTSGEPGGHGLYAYACPTVGLFDSTLTGGDGGGGAGSLYGDQSGGGAGGCGVFAEDHSHVFSTGCTLTGGSGGSGAPDGPDGYPVCLYSGSTFTTATAASGVWVLYP